MIIRVGTFNIQNKYRIDKYDGVDNNGDNVDKLIDFIYDNKIDILGVQELTTRFRKNLLKKISDNYNIVGSPRFFKFLNFLPLINKYNEYNSIISNQCIYSFKTKYLSIFGGLPRIMTYTVMNINGYDINVINTHIDHRSKMLRSKQLKKLLKYISKYNNLVITGDFNCNIHNEEFSKFINAIDKLGYKRIDCNEQTHRVNKLPIDHIFVSKKYKVKSIKVLNTGFSDHKAIIVDIEL